MKGGYSYSLPQNKRKKTNKGPMKKGKKKASYKKMGCKK